MAIPTSIIKSVEPCLLSPRQVEVKFHSLLANGAQIRSAGTTKRSPRRLLSLGYTPKQRLRLFDTTFYFTHVRQNPELRFYIAYVVQASSAGGKVTIYPRIFYKDLSLVWRTASHFHQGKDGLWVGKGDVRTVHRHGEEIAESVEATTDLPFEIQNALETMMRNTRKVRSDQKALALILRHGNENRIAPFADFTSPRRRAQQDRSNLINRGRSVARFRRNNDPSSLYIVPGYEPDFRSGIIDRYESMSKLYGGKLQKIRIISKNQKIQYLFFAGPKHVWIAPPQATTTQLSSYGVRTIDVKADDDLFIPGYEYHYLDDPEDPTSLYSQIPKGFVGDGSPIDPDKADASPWLNQIPVIRQFRKIVLRQ